MLNVKESGKDKCHEMPEFELPGRKIIGVDSGLKNIWVYVEAYAQINQTVMLKGETGTGKNLVALEIHRRSSRKKWPFIEINCANIPENIFESELFGHEKGSFTGALKTKRGRIEDAEYGTLFLDEIGDLSPENQPKILRLLNSREFERLGGNKTRIATARIIVATNKNDERLKKTGFRQDLYYRMDILSITIPPLRERREDIEELAVFFCEKYCAEFDVPKKKFSKEAIAYMVKNHNWDGNIRELENYVQRAVVGSNAEKREIIEITDFGIEDQKKECQKNNKQTIKKTRPKSKVDEVNRKLIVDALVKNDWRQDKAAKDLGISPRKINYAVEKYEISHPHDKWRRRNEK